MYNKKGVSMIVVGLIITVLVLALLSYFLLYIFKPSVESTTSTELCRESVYLKAKAKSLDLQQHVNLQCQTENVQISDLNQLTTSGPSLIANAMYDCWNEFGEGQKDFLTDYDFGKGTLFCFPCARIDFDKSLTGNKINLGDYLQSNSLPLHKETYVGYFTQTKDTNFDLTLFNNLPTDKSLYVMFFAKKSSDIYQYLKTLVISSKPAVIQQSTVLGAVTFTAVGCAAGTIIPGLGNIAGCFIGAIVGTSGFTLTEQYSYVPGIFVTNAQDTIKLCTTGVQSTQTPSGGGASGTQ